MQGNYGTRFLNQWKTGQTLDDGSDAGVVNAMGIWGKKLAGFAEYPECIGYVLDHLPPEPPSLPQFIDLCRRAPAKEVLALPHKLTEEDHRRAAEAAKAAKRAVEADGFNKVDHWATHPRSHMHLKMIFEAAAKEARFRASVEQMVQDGICTADGKLLKRYCGMSNWEAA